jgi:undecaprenyl-diphosphatase
MNLFQAIVLGIVQGLTEFLPISSSGHLLLVPKAFGWDDPGAAFTAVIQLGTMLAVVIYFWRDIVQVGGVFFRGLFSATARQEHDGREWRLAWVIVVGTIPISVLGLIFKDFIEDGARNVALVGVTLIIGGLLMEAADRIGALRRTTEDARQRDGWLIGLGQAAALIPGMSRSGSTLTVARLLAFERKEAARISFLLSIPAVVLSGLVELPKAFDGDLDAMNVIVATIVAFVVGYASIRFLLAWLGSHRLTIFTVYRVILGAIVLVVIAIN